MASYNGEEKCAPMTWATLAGDVHNEVLVYTKVQLPEINEMFDELIECITESTDERIRNIDPNGFGISIINNIINEGPWEIHTDDQATLLLYKLWYDTITLRMGVKPQVLVHSQQKPNGMPKHWVHVYKAPEIQWSYDANQDVLYNNDGGVRIEYMHPDTQPEPWFDDKDAPIPMVHAQAMPAMPAVPSIEEPPQPVQQAQLPWYHPNWVPDVPFAGQPVRWSSRKHSAGVIKLSYDSKGQCETNSLISQEDEF